MADDVSADAAAERLARALQRLEAAAQRLSTGGGAELATLKAHHQQLGREVEAALAGLDRLIASAEGR